MHLGILVFQIKIISLLAFFICSFNVLVLFHVIVSLISCLCLSFHLLYLYNYVLILFIYISLLCRNPFLGSSKLHFIFLKKKKPEHFERIVLLLPYACRGREEEDFKCFFPLSLSPPHLPRNPGTTHTHTYPATMMKNQESLALWTAMLRPYPAPRQWQGSHLALLRGKGKVPLSLCAY
jgi:hypothetical protein